MQIAHATGLEMDMPRDAALSVRVRPALKSALEVAAKEDRRSLASMAEKILIEYLEDKGYLLPGAAD